jgi:uncharacterized alpha-E superfamily protein
LLRASGNAAGYSAKYGAPDQANIESYLFFDRDNPNSVASCITNARENGRIIRTALTTQVWDALNTAFQELRQIESQRLQHDLSHFSRIGRRAMPQWRAVRLMPRFCAMTAITS